MAREIIDIIHTAARSGSRTLNLSRKGLTELPPEIGRLKMLSRLDLSGNQLLQVPEQLWELTGLTDLDLAGNRIKVLPPDIRNLRALTRLDVSGNRLAELPPEFAELAELNVLNLSGNDFERFPFEILGTIRPRELDLSKNRPEQLGAGVGLLKGCKVLNLSGNSLTQLPREIGALTDLQMLDLSRNQLTEVPPQFGKLANLSELDLSRNKLTSLPPEIGNLTNIGHMPLYGNELRALPDEIGRLTRLTEFNLSQNSLDRLTPEIGRLKNLTELDISGNKLAILPPALGELPNLQYLPLEGNPLISPPPAVVKQGPAVLLSYLREMLKDSLRQWVSKLLVVGEGGVGKTCLVRALRGEDFKDQETTHGISIGVVELDHPTKEGTKMYLKTWDFGGQEIYHATHQFFLSDYSLFILAWNARHGFEQGNLYYWLDIIKARAPEAAVILVATHLDERDAKLPINELKKKYPNIVGDVSVSNKSGRGIPDLKEALTKAAADLPLMGEQWPGGWLRAAEAVNGLAAKHITSHELFTLIESKNVKGDTARILAQRLHELGDILFFQDDKELCDLVILKPQWVTRRISQVLEDDRVIDGLGLLSHELMNELWSDLEPEMRLHFLRMMEKFDLSYRTLDAEEVSIVVERLQLDPPDFEPLWEEVRSRTPFRNLIMKFELNTVPPGIPTWFIAREHRFTTRNHWRYGALFRDESGLHYALVRSNAYERYLILEAVGPHPDEFMALLHDGLEYVLARYPGLEITRKVPCPGHDGRPCSYEFNYRRLRMLPDKGVMAAQCHETGEMVSIVELLYAWDYRSTRQEVLYRLEDLMKEYGDAAQEDRLEFEVLSTLAAREFVHDFHGVQSKADSHCPNLFTLDTAELPSGDEGLQGRTATLHLMCQNPACRHLTEEGGVYTFELPGKWLETMAPYIREMMPHLEHMQTMMTPMEGIVSRERAEEFVAVVEGMKTIVEHLPELDETRKARLLEDLGPEGMRRRLNEDALRVLRGLLDEYDKAEEWGGLKKILTPEGHYLWLCRKHAEAYRL